MGHTAIEEPWPAGKVVQVLSPWTVGLSTAAILLSVLLSWRLQRPLWPGMEPAVLTLVPGLAAWGLCRLQRLAGAAAWLVWGLWAAVLLGLYRMGGAMYSPLVALPGLLALCAWVYGLRAALLMLALSLTAAWLLLSPVPAMRIQAMAQLGSALAWVAAGTLAVRRSVRREAKRARAAHSALQRQQDELRMFHSAVEQNPHSIVITDPQHHIVYVNQAFLVRTGFAREDVIGQPAQRHSRMGLSLQAHEAMQQRLAQGKPWRGKLTNKTRQGEDLPETVLIAPIRSASGSISHHVEIKQDLAKQQQARRQIHDLVHLDTLTGLPNRLSLSLRLHALTASQTRQQHALLLVNIDRFTAFNDAQGMGRGDALLRALALRLEENLPPHALLAHVGADEFAVLLEDMGMDDQAERRMQQAAQGLQQALARPLQLDGSGHPAPGVRLTCCIGGCRFAAHGGILPQDALRHASLTLRQAKLRGPGQVLMFAPSMAEAADRRFRTEQDLRQAIQAGDLRLYFQSQMDRHGRCLGVEALVRWKHPQLGLIPPQDFIAVAEESEIIVLLGDWVLDTACRMLASRQFAPQAWRISVNVSGRQFCQDDFAIKLHRILRETRADPGRLTLEITESVAMHDMQQIRERMLQLQALGVELGLDDFGTGYSSLSCLQQLPFQELKIDRSFVRDCTANPGAASMTEAILLMAQRLGLRVVAEGVEDETQVATLRGWHPDILCQGYLYDQPQPAKDWLRRQETTAAPHSLPAETAG